MQVPESPAAPSRNGLTNRWTIAQLIISGLGMVLSLFAAGILAIIGLISLASDNTVSTQAPSIFGLAWVALFVAALALPSLFYGYQRLSGRELRLALPDGYRVSTLLLLVWPVVLALGALIANTSIAWLLLPPLLLLAVAIPLWWLVERARRKLPLNSPQRSWGLLSFSIFITTPIATVVEILVFIFIFIAFVIWISSRPDLAAQMEQLGRQIIQAQGSPEQILTILQPYVQNPLAVYGVLGLIAGLIPLIEELVKPLGVWLLAGRELTPARGFAAGAVCGGAFALLESLLSLTGPAGSGAGWLGLVIARAGTGLLHITTTALVGWGIATALSAKRGWLRLILAYLAAAALHGIWNFYSLLFGLASLIQSPSGPLRLLMGLAPLAPVGMFVMIILLISLLLFGNRTLRREAGALPKQELDGAGEPHP
jgi:hypothetical protein